MNFIEIDEEYIDNYSYFLSKIKNKLIVRIFSLADFKHYENNFLYKNCIFIVKDRSINLSSANNFVIKSSLMCDRKKNKKNYYHLLYLYLLKEADLHNCFETCNDYHKEIVDFVDIIKNHSVEFHLSAIYFFLLNINQCDEFKPSQLKQSKLLIGTLLEESDKNNDAFYKLLFMCMKNNGIMNSNLKYIVKVNKNKSFLFERFIIEKIKSNS